MFIKVPDDDFKWENYFWDIDMLYDAICRLNAWGSMRHCRGKPLPLRHTDEKKQAEMFCRLIHENAEYDIVYPHRKTGFQDPPDKIEI